MRGRMLFLFALASVIGVANAQGAFAQLPEPSSDSLFCGRPISSFANVIDGTSGPDILHGTDQDDLIRGFAGDDVIFGKGGNDCLKGYEGDDKIWGGEGDDYLMGLEGNDHLVGDAGNDIVFAGDGDDSVWGNAGDDKMVGEDGNDRINGDEGNDSIFGNDGEDQIWGGDGDDFMVGGADNDRLVGDGGDDKIWGGPGDDVLLGLAGDDRMVGDDGNDKMYGHEGNDILYDDQGNDGLNGGDGIDSCYDTVGTNVFFNCEEQDSKDQKGDASFKDFDIKNFGFDGSGEAFVEVYGMAGGTLPSGEHTIFAYVIHTDTGIYASDSHEAQHADDEETADLSWHGHNVEVDDEGCLSELGSFKSSALLAGDRIVITDTEATEIFLVQTVRLELQVEDPDNPPEGVTCIAKVVEVFDEAVPAG